MPTVFIRVLAIIFGGTDFWDSGFLYLPSCLGVDGYWEEYSKRAPWSYPFFNKQLSRLCVWSPPIGRQWTVFTAGLRNGVSQTQGLTLAEREHWGLWRDGHKCRQEPLKIRNAAGFLFLQLGSDILYLKISVLKHAVSTWKAAAFKSGRHAFQGMPRLLQEASVPPKHCLLLVFWSSTSFSMCSHTDSDVCFLFINFLPSFLSFFF